MSRLSRLLGALAQLLFICATGTVAQAQTSSPQIALGVTWLVAQVQSDGTLLNEHNSVATIFQNRSEAAQTLKLLASLPPSLGTVVATDGDGNTEYLSRQAVTASFAGLDASSYLAGINASQNSDGGFGGAPGYLSDALDSAWAVLALAQAGQGNSGAAVAGRNYLASQIGSDGGIVPINAGTTDWQRVSFSAMAALAMQTGGDTVSTNNVRQLTSWLLQRQGIDGSWQTDTYLTALALLAVSPVTVDPTVQTTGSLWLLAKQASDGSWNDDPFLTAVVLRALNIRGSSSTGSGNATASYHVTVVNPANGAGLSGVAVTLSGASSASGATNANGQFSAANLAAGNYSVQFALSGYATLTQNLTLAAAQTYSAAPVTLPLANGTGQVSGQITSTSGAGLAGVAITVSGSSSAATSSDANGYYQLNNLAPGSMTITAALNGYQSASASVTIGAAQTLSFSPTLYVNGTTAPTTGSVTGKVYQSGATAGLAGVTLTLSGGPSGSITASTAADGSFTLTLAPSAYQITYSLSGYNPIVQNIVVAAGASINLGSIPLSAALTSSTISGFITSQNGQPLGGAVVTSISDGSNVTSVADGSYTLAGLSGTVLNLRITATGYASQNITINTSAPALLTQNIVLQPAANSAALALSNLSVSPASIGSNSTVNVDVVITNGSASVTASAVVMLKVLDGSGNMIGSGTATSATNGSLLGVVTLQPGQSLPARLIWNSGRFPAGTYTLAARLVEPGSLTRTTPNGTVVTEQRGTVIISNSVHFSGGVTANPPVVQQGTNTTVSLSATMQNDGNVAIPAQSYQLSITDVASGSVVATQQTQGTATPVNGILTLNFAGWLPASGGNYRIDVQAADPAQGTASTLIYVGTAATGAYTVNHSVVPAGTQNVHATLKISGQSSANAVLTDPLTPLVQAAIQKAVTYGDSVGVSHTVNDLRCFACHVQTQSVVGGELSRKLVPNYDVNKRNLLLNTIINDQQNDGTVNPENTPTTASMLALWAMNAWHDQSRVLQPAMQVATYLSTIQNPDGSWPPDSSSWFRGQVSITATNVKSFADLTASIAANPNAGVNASTYATEPWSGYASQLTGPVRLRSDAAGNVYVIPADHIDMVRPDGSAATLAYGMSYNDLLPMSDGSYVIATPNGLYRLGADSTTTPIPGTSAAFALAQDGSGNIYFSASNGIYKLDSSGTVSLLIAGNGLNQTNTLAVDAAGNVLAASDNKVMRISPAGNVDMATSVNSNGATAIQNIVAIPNGWLVTTSWGLYRYSSDWQVAERLNYVAGSSADGSANTSGTAQLPDGTILVSTTSSGLIMKIIQGKIATPTNWIYSPASAYGYSYPYATPQAIAKDGAGNVYVGQYDANIYRVHPDGSAEFLANAGDGIRGLGVLADGRLLVSTWGHIYQWTQAGGLVSIYGNGYPAGYSNTVDDGSGGFYFISAAQVYHYTLQDGFVATGWYFNAPTGMVLDQDGSVLVLSHGASQIYRLDLRGGTAPKLVVDLSSWHLNMFNLLDDGKQWIIPTARCILTFDRNWNPTGRYNDHVYDPALGGTAVVLDEHRFLYGPGNYSYNPAGLVFHIMDLNPSVTGYTQKFASAIQSGTNWLMNDSLAGQVNDGNNMSLAFRLMGLNAARKYYAGQDQAAAIKTKMDSIATILAARQLPDGGWGWMTSNSSSDSMVTAQVGIALDYQNPSPSSPQVRKAVLFLLGSQHADGTWLTENGIDAPDIAGQFITTTWVEIWLPTILDRLGAIDTTASVTFPANVAMSHSTATPTTTTVNADNSTTYTWQLTGVTADGQQIDYDLALANMALGETRAVSSDAHLTFKNSFTGDNVNAPIGIPSVTASAFLTMTAGTDHSSYGPNTLATLNATVSNSASYAQSGSVRFDIVSADGSTVIANAGTSSFANIAPAGSGSGSSASSQSVTGFWNTGSTLVGSYAVRATLLDSQGRTVSSAVVPFAMSAGTGSATGNTGSSLATSQVSTDQQTYAPGATVTVNSRTTNISVNAILGNLTVTTTVTNPDGSVRVTHAETLPQLVAGALKNYTYAITLGSNAAAGAYTVSTSVTDGTGSVLSSSSTSYQVLSTAMTGVGLTGTISAAPKKIAVGDAVGFSFSVANQGNSAVSALPLNINIVNPASGKLIASLPYSATVAIGGNYLASATWTSSGKVGDILIATLTASVGSGSAASTLTLAQDSFTLIQVPVKLGLTTGINKDLRLLVLVSCPSGASVQGHGDHGDDHGDDGGDDDHHSYSPPQNTCTAARVKAIDSSLTALGIAHYVTDSASVFATELQCGRYNGYWISGGTSALSSNTVKEVREAVQRGNGLLVDDLSGQTGSNGGDNDGQSASVSLDNVLGIAELGTLRLVNPNVKVTGSLLLSPSAATTLATQTNAGDGSGPALNLAIRASSASAQAVFATQPGQPAIVSNTFGSGRTMTMAFDLAATLTSETAGSSTALAWQAALQAVLANLSPDIPVNVVGGALVPIRLTVTNQITDTSALPTQIEVIGQLPAGASAVTSGIGASAPTPDYGVAGYVGQPVWRFSLATNAAQTVVLGLRAPAVSGTSNIGFTVNSLDASGNRKPYNSITQALTVRGAEIISPTIVPAINALSLTTQAQKQVRSRALADVQSAQANASAGQYANAIAAWLLASDDLRSLATDSYGSFSCAKPTSGSGSSGNNLSAASIAALNAIVTDIDRLIQAAELGQCGTLPVCSATQPSQIASSLFTAFADNERMEARSGNGSYGQCYNNDDSWQWALGTQVGNGNNYAGSKDDDHNKISPLVTQRLTWANNKVYGWTLTYNGTGGGTMSVTDGASTLFTKTFTQPSGSSGLRTGNALRLAVKRAASVPASGSNSSQMTATLNSLGGFSTSGAPLATSNLASDLTPPAVCGKTDDDHEGSTSVASAIWFLPAMRNGLSAQGTLKLSFPGKTPPAGNALDFVVNAGNALCRQ